MISNNQQSNETPLTEEELDEIQVNREKELAQSRDILGTLQAFSGGTVDGLIVNKLNEQYRVNLLEAVNGENSDRKRVNALERNLGISHALGIIPNLIKQVEDDITYLQEQLSDD